MLPEGAPSQQLRCDDNLKQFLTKRRGGRVADKFAGSEFERSRLATVALSETKGETHGWVEQDAPEERRV